MPPAKDDAGVDDICVPEKGFSKVDGVLHTQDLPDHIHLASGHRCRVVHVRTVVHVGCQDAEPDQAAFG